MHIASSGRPTCLAHLALGGGRAHLPYVDLLELALPRRLDLRTLSRPGRARDSVPLEAAAGAPAEWHEEDALHDLLTDDGAALAHDCAAAGDGAEPAGDDAPPPPAPLALLTTILASFTGREGSRPLRPAAPA